MSSRELEAPYGVPDLMQVTGMGRDKVKALIDLGELPGYHHGRAYTVPAEAFHAYCRGEWVPLRLRRPDCQPAPITPLHPEPPIDPSSLIRHRKTA